MTAEDGGLGLAMLDGYNLYTLSRGTTGIDGQVGWGNKRLVSLCDLLPAGADIERMHVAAAVNVLGLLLIGTDVGLFSYDMKSGQVKKLCDGDLARHMGEVVPYLTLRTPGILAH